MAKSRDPHIQFFPRDWLGDANLQMCGLAAQGLWMWILCYAHQEGEPYGHLAKNGKAVPLSKIAKAVRSDAPDVECLLSILEEEGVFSKTKEGVIYSRRLIRDKAERDKYLEIRGKRAKAGASGGKKTQKKVLLKQNPEFAKANVSSKSKAMAGVEMDMEMEMEDSKPSKGTLPKAKKPALEKHPDILRVLDAYEQKLKTCPTRKAAAVWIARRLCIPGIRQTRPAVKVFSAEELLAAIDRYAGECIGREPKFIKGICKFFSNSDEAPLVDHYADNQYKPPSGQAAMAERNRPLNDPARTFDQ